MLPAELTGPGKEIRFESPGAFLAANQAKYPQLADSFIVQVCFEHPRRFNELLPGFDAHQHRALEVTRTPQWVSENVRYDDNSAVDFWFCDFDRQRATGTSKYEVFLHMVSNGVWPFPPVIVSASFAATLGAPGNIGKPYHLIEGTHRVSYLLRMLQLGLVQPEAPVSLIEVSQ